LRFPGQYYDKETNLHYNYFRDYDPQTGRYIESDPVGLNAGINTYTYVDSNPLRYFDPIGQSKVQGQSSIGGSDSAVSGISKSSTKAEIDAAIKRAEAILNDPKASPIRKKFLKGWVKVAKRGFTKAVGPPFLEEITMAVQRELCLRGDMHACALFEYMGGEIIRDDML
jgi:RHS repeat-associated protein